MSGPNKFVVQLPICYYRAFVFVPHWGMAEPTTSEFVRAQTARLLRSFGYWTPWAVGLSVGCGIVGEYFLPVAFALAFIASLFPYLIWPFLVLTMVRGFEVKLTSLHRSKLRTAILALAERCQFPVKDISKTDVSRWIIAGDIFISGVTTYSINLADSLIQKTAVDDIVAMLGLEVAHTQYHHFWKSILLDHIR